MSVKTYPYVTAPEGQRHPNRVLKCLCGNTAPQWQMAAHLHFFRWSIAAEWNVFDETHGAQHALVSDHDGTESEA